QVRLNAIRGNFRLIGGSNSNAYSIQTPSGLVRLQSGTVDITAGGPRGAYVVTLGGQALMCDAHHKCAIIRGDCTFASATGAGSFGLASTDKSERRRLLRELFPLISAQSGLASNYQAPVRSCGLRGQQP